MDLCRSKGVISFKGSLEGASGSPEPFEFLFGPPPAPPMTAKEQAAAEAKARDPQARKRQHYKDLLGREVISDEELAQLPDGF